MNHLISFWKMFFAADFLVDVFWSTHKIKESILVFRTATTFLITEQGLGRVKYRHIQGTVQG